MNEFTKTVAIFSELSSDSTKFFLPLNPTNDKKSVRKNRDRAVISPSHGDILMFYSLHTYFLLPRHRDVKRFIAL